MNDDPILEPNEYGEELIDIVSIARETVTAEDTIQIERLKAIIFEVAEHAANHEDPDISQSAENYLRVHRIPPADWPKGLVRSVTTNHFLSFDTLLDSMGMPKDLKLRHEVFFNYYPEVYVKPEKQSSLLNIFTAEPQNPLELQFYQGRLTNFKLLTANFIHTNLLKAGSLERIDTSLASISMLSDYYDLQTAIAKGQVWYSSLDTIFDAIVFRAMRFSKEIFKAGNLPYYEHYNSLQVASAPKNLEVLYKPNRYTTN